MAATRDVEKELKDSYVQTRAHTDEEVHCRRSLSTTAKDEYYSTKLATATGPDSVNTVQPGDWGFQASCACGAEYRMTGLSTRISFSSQLL